MSSADTPTVPTIHAGDTNAPALALGGYELRELLGRGGMGEVVLAHDERIGRDVALKRMLGAAPTGDAFARFLREAKIQARLDHPAIVPVHELGNDADGRPYFTMKRLAGTTLQELLRGEPEPRRLLRAFVDVSLALEFAHSRGVVHRDVKPANIMLGDFGEVYVLDWGVARVIAEADAVTEPGTPNVDGKTEAGAMLGTPGYMAPEQIRGETVGPAADVYALGAILFEILAGEPLHPRGTGAIAATLGEPTVAPASRVDRAIAPELDAACVAALAESPAARPSARVLADRVQRYLDGDRDGERRRALATEQLAIAKALLATGDETRRGEAMRTASRALALDLESEPAARLVAELLLSPPVPYPQALRDKLRKGERVIATADARSGAITLCCYLAFFPLLLWIGIRDAETIGIALAVVALQIGYAVWSASKRQPNAVPFLVSNVVLMVAMSRLCSPFIIVPSIVCTFTVALVQQPRLLARPWLVVLGAIAAVAIPLVLEATGVFAPTWEITGNAIVIHSTALWLGDRAAVLLVVGNLALVTIPALLGWVLAKQRQAALHQLEAQAWNLRQLVPLDDVA
jgi:eukaryotic-like serine/threonine-protein kinase